MFNKIIMIKIYNSLYEQLYINENNKKIIPTDDEMAIDLYPKYSIYYDKRFWCKVQNLKYGFNKPNNYPIVIKPYQNLKGMSIGFKIIKSRNEFKLHKGQFWMQYLQGEHLCIDLFILKGKIVLYTIIKSYSAGDGTFNYHESLPNRKLNHKIRLIVEKYFNNYTGTLNCETINNQIIDFHLRLNGDFYLYDDKILQEIKKLYYNQQWNIKLYKVPKKYLIPIFINKNLDFKVKIQDIEKKLIKYNANNLMIDDINSEIQSPGGGRIFMFEVLNLEDGINCRKEILLLFNRKNNLYNRYILLIILGIIIIVFYKK